MTEAAIAVERSEVRFAGLDGIRALAAIWVAIAHGAAFPLKESLVWVGVPQAIVPISLNEFWFNSTAAVVVFFVISGFCIHRPYIDGRPLQVAPYLTRRLLRVGIPLIVVLAFLVAVGGPIGAAGRGVLWTVYCELIYYVLYPVLLFIGRRIGMMTLLVVATTVAFGVIVASPTQTLFGQWSWLVCLPSWLVGCVVAERWQARDHSSSDLSIWVWRGLVLALSIAALWLVFHSSVRAAYPISMILFSFAAAAWIKKELTRYRAKRPTELLERIGRFSYSIYLVHPIALVAVDSLDWALSFMVLWLLQVAAAFGLSFAFFLAVERPSHRLAHMMSRRYSTARSTA